MFRKNYLIGFFTIVLFLIGSMAAVAQNTAAVRGRVEMKGADGKSTPMQGVLVEVFRMDIKSKGPSSTTGKNGTFSFAGLMLGADYVISLSGPGINPEIIPNIKAGREDLVLNVSAGDGKRFSEDEVRKGISSTTPTPTGELTAEQKKQKEDFDKQVAETNAKNAKIQSQNTSVKTALDEGNKAFGSKNYDVAIAKYEEGYQANPTFVGSAPVLLNNKAAALKERAVSNYNANKSNPDAGAKVAALAKVQEDLAASADAYSKAYTMLKNAPAAEAGDPKALEGNKTQSLNGAKDAFRIMALIKQVDPNKLETAKMMTAEYLTVESDQAKKTEAQRILGDIYLAAGDGDNAIVEYKKVLEMNATDPDALAGIGLSLVLIGYNTNEKAKFQEAADYFQRFIDVAPANHALLASVKESLDDLKASQNVAPQKGKNTPTKKKN